MGILLKISMESAFGFGLLFLGDPVELTCAKAGDVNDSGGFDADDVLRTWDPLAASSSVTVTGGAEVTFFATGEANNTFSFELDDSEASGSAADAAKRCVEVTATGQVRSKRWNPDQAWSCP